MMKKTRKRLILALALCLTLSLAAFAGCGTKDNPTPPDTGSSPISTPDDSSSSKPPVSTRPKITVDTADLSGVMGEEITLPTASAHDDTDGDLTSVMQVTVYFARDTLTVYQQADGSKTHKFTPKKVGEYTVIYKVSNSLNKTARQEVVLNVADNPDMSETGKQLVADRENWVMTGQNGFDEDGGLKLVATSGTSIAYGGRKILSGDTVSFRFSVDLGNEMFYSVNAAMSASYALDKPITTESKYGFPAMFGLRVGAGGIEAYICSCDNKQYPFDRIDKKVLDGNDHTISVRSTLDAENETVKFELWVDTDIEATPAWNKSLTKEAIINHYGQDTFVKQFIDMFDAEKFGGWFNVGAYGGSGEGSGYMVVKAMTVNGEQYINSPELTVNGELEASYIVNEEITFPAAKAEDTNTYSNLASRIELNLITPSGEVVKIENNKYTPAVTGNYTLVYSVTDYGGNLAKKVYEFSVATVINTQAPVISFGDDQPEVMQATVGVEFTLPVPASATDEQGNDLLSRVKAELIGSESADLKGKTSIIFYAQGKHIIRYSVTDDCALTGVKEIVVNVAGIYTKDQNLAANGTYVSENSGVFTENGIHVRYTGKVAGQKVYDEKLTFKIKGNLLGSFIYINIRGGKNLDAPDNLSLDWQNGLLIKLSCALGKGGDVGITYGGHDQNQETYAVPSALGKGLDELVADGITVTVQATDVTDENGNVTAVVVKFWINDVLVTAESGRVFDSKFIAKNPGILQAGWLTFAGVEYGDGKDLTKLYIKEITVDDGSAVEISAEGGETGGEQTESEKEQSATEAENKKDEESGEDNIG